MQSGPAASCSLLSSQTSSDFHPQKWETSSSLIWDNVDDNLLWLLQSCGMYAARTAGLIFR